MSEPEEHLNVSSLDTLLRGSVLIFLGNIIGTGSSFAVRIFTAQYLGPSSYGSIVLSLSIINIALIFILLGLPEGIARYLPRIDRNRSVFSMVLVVVLVNSIIVTAVLFGVSATLSQIFGGNSFSLIFLPFIISLPLWALLRTMVGGFRGLEEPVPRILSQNLAHQGLRIPMILLAIFLGASALGIAMAWIAPVLIAVFVAGYLLHSRYDLISLSQLRSIPRNDIDETKKILIFSLPIMLSGAVWMVMFEIDKILLGFFRSPSVVGIYDAAFTTSRVLLIFMTSAEFLFLPMLSRYHSEGDKDRLRWLYKSGTKWMVFGSLPIYLVIVSFPQQVLSLAFGPEYTGATVSLIIITTGFMFYLITGLTSEALIAIGHTRIELIGTLVAFLSGIILNLSLIPFYGGTGAAVASALSYGIIANTFWLVSLYKIEEIQPFSWSYLKSVGVSVLVFFTVASSLSAIINDQFWSFLGSILIFAVLYPLILYLVGGIDQRELDMLPIGKLLR